MELENFLVKSREVFNKNEELYLYLKIITNAPRTDFVDVLSGQKEVLKIKVRAIPEKGKANNEIRKFLKKKFSAKKIEIVSGEVSSQKLVKLIK